MTIRILRDDNIPAKKVKYLNRMISTNDKFMGTLKAYNRGPNVYTLKSILPKCIQQKHYY